VSSCEPLTTLPGPHRAPATLYLPLPTFLLEKLWQAGQELQAAHCGLRPPPLSRWPTHSAFSFLGHRGEDRVGYSPLTIQDHAALRVAGLLARYRTQGRSSLIEPSPQPRAGDENAAGHWVDSFGLLSRRSQRLSFLLRLGSVAGVRLFIVGRGGRTENVVADSVRTMIEHSPQDLEAMQFGGESGLGCASQSDSCQRFADRSAHGHTPNAKATSPAIAPPMA